MSVESSEFWSRFRAGEEQALRQVYEAHVDDVMKLAQCGFMVRGGGRIRGIAQGSGQHEVIHEVFVRAFGEQARLRFDSARPFRPYLMQITKNLMIDRARRDGARARREVMDSERVERTTIEPGDGLCPEERIDWKRQIAATREYLDALSPELREFVALRFEEGLAQNKVAETLGVTRRHVRTLEKTAMTGLVKTLRSKNLIAARALRSAA